MAKKSVKKNFIFSLVFQLLTLIAPLVTTPYIAHVIGRDGVGLYSYTNSIVTYFVLFAALGTTTFGLRKVSFYQDNKEERSRAFWEIFFFRLILSVFTLAVYLVIFTVIMRENWEIYLILAMSILTVVFDVSWFLQGLEEFGKTATRNAICKIISIALIFILVKKPSDLPIYVLITVCGTAAGSLSMVPHLPKYVCWVKGINPFRDTKGIILLFIPTIAMQIYTVIDRSMLGWFDPSMSENGYYEQAEKLVRATLTVVTAFGIVVAPRIGHLFAEHDDEGVKFQIYRVYRAVWMLGLPMLCGWIAVADYIVPLYLAGGEFDKCRILLPILSALPLIIGMNTATNTVYLVPTNRHNVFTIIVTIGAVINIILNLILIPFFFSIGASIATVAAETCILAAGFIYIAKKKLFSLKPVFTCSVKYIIASLVMLGGLYLLRYFLPLNVWAMLLLVFAGVAIYFICLLILRDKLFMQILRSGLGKLRRKKSYNGDPEATLSPYPLTEVPEKEEGSGQSTKE